MVNKRAIIIWLAITILVMLALPFAVARLASECSGMALCMMLFLIVNPIYSAILGYRCGKDIKKNVESSIGVSRSVSCRDMDFL